MVFLLEGSVRLENKSVIHLRNQLKGAVEEKNTHF